MSNLDVDEVLEETIARVVEEEDAEESLLHEALDASIAGVSNDG